MLVVLPFHAGDCQKMVRLLNWCLRVAGRTSYENHQCLAICPTNTDPKPVFEFVKEMFGDAHTLQYEEGRWRGWPRGPNRMFTQAASYVGDKIPCTQWYWMESDVVPVAKDWLEKLEMHCTSTTKPYHGFFGPGPNGPYMAGCGVYPKEIRLRASNAWFTEETPFDIAIGPQISRFVTPLNGLLCHEGHTGGTTGALGTFKDDDDVAKRIPIDAILFHKCKDDSLIKLLERQYQWSVLRFEKDYSVSPTEGRLVLKAATRKREKYYKKVRKEGVEQFEPREP
jgi:hypothetical protein